MFNNISHRPISDFRCFKLITSMFVVKLWKKQNKKKTLQYKVLLPTSLQYFTEMYWNTLLLGFLFLGKRNAGSIDFLSLIL